MLFRVEDEPGLIVETHQHLYHEFDLVLEGSGSYRCGRQSFEAKTGDIFYIARGFRHRRESSLESPLKLCNIDIPDAALRQDSQELKPWPLLHRWRGAGIPKAAQDAFEQLSPLMPEKAGAALKLDGAAQRNACKSLAEALDFQSALLGRKAPYLAKLAGRIATRPELKFPLEQEAAEAGVTKFQLCRAFKQAFGAGMVEYRDLARADLAIAALRAGAESVERLGRRLGYSSKAHFANAFKRAAGATPGSFKPKSD